MDLEIKLKDQIIKLSKNKITHDDIDENTNFIEKLGFDSILIVQLVTELEDYFGIIFNDDDMEIEILSNYKKIKDLIIGKVSAL